MDVAIDRFTLYRVRRKNRRKERAKVRAAKKKSSRGGMMALNGFVWNLIFKGESSNTGSSEVVGSIEDDLYKKETSEVKQIKEVKSKAEIQSKTEEKLTEEE